MSAMKLLKAMEYLDDELILEADSSEGIRHRRILSRPLVAAAVLLAGIVMVTACTAIGGAAWFLEFFYDASPGKLSTEQVEYIAANTVDVNKSESVNGYTLTLQSVFSDGRDILIQFELTAPQGVVLDADGYGDCRGVILESDAAPSAMAMEWKLQDNERTDNKVKLIFSIETAWNQAETFAERNCRLYIYGLEGRWHEKMEVRTETLTEGCWTYDIHFPANCNKSISFVEEPVPVTQTVIVDFEKTGENTMRAVTEIQEGHITSLKLWSLGAELSFRFGEEERNAELGDLYAVMKNGERIRMKRNFGAPDFITYKVETPILLDQVDHLELEDGPVFPLP